MSAVGVGIIGVGVISDTYLENLNSFPDVEVLVGLDDGDDAGDLVAFPDARRAGAGRFAADVDQGRACCRHRHPGQQQGGGR